MPRPEFTDGVARGKTIAALLLIICTLTNTQINRSLEIRKNFIFDYKGSTEINQQAIDIVKSSNLRTIKDSYNNLGNTAKSYISHCTSVQYIYPRTFQQNTSTEFQPICRSDPKTKIEYQASDEDITNCVLTWTESKKGCQKMQKQLPEVHTRIMKENLSIAMRKFGTKSIPAGILINPQTYHPYFISSGEDAYDIMKDIHGTKNVFSDKCPLAVEKGIKWTNMARRDRARASVVYEIIDNNLTPCLHIADEFTTNEEKFVAFCQRKPQTQFEKNKHKWYLPFQDKCKKDENKMMLELENTRRHFNSIIPSKNMEVIPLPYNFRRHDEFARTKRSLITPANLIMGGLIGGDITSTFFGDEIKEIIQNISSGSATPEEIRKFQRWRETIETAKTYHRHYTLTETPFIKHLTQNDRFRKDLQDDARLLEQIELIPDQNRYSVPSKTLWENLAESEEIQRRLKEIKNYHELSETMSSNVIAEQANTRQRDMMTTFNEQLDKINDGINKIETSIYRAGNNYADQTILTDEELNDLVTTHASRNQVLVANRDKIKTIYTYQNGSCHFRFIIPLSNPRNNIYTYQITALPQPTEKESVTYQTPILESKYIGISTAADTYVTITNEEMEKCFEPTSTGCTIATPFRS